MNITHYISPRQTGKTTKAIELFRQFYSPRCYIVVSNSIIKRRIQRYLGIHSNQILLPNETSFIGRNIETLIIDDYLLIINDTNLFWSYTWPAFVSDNAQIFLFSTPSKKYTESEIIDNTYLFLGDSPLWNFNVNLNVIHTICNPELYGFMKINGDERERTYRHMCRSQEEFDCEFLGLYKDEQNFDELAERFFIPKPKKFKLLR